MKFRTIKKAAESKITVKGSKFLGYAFPVENEDEINTILTSLRKKHYDATHHCYAWRLGSGDRAAFRYNDDGEPSGTAGKPLYQAMLHRDLSYVLLVSVRYFGGTKLGTGGLIRAYGQSATETLDTAKILTIERGDKIRFSCSYEEHALILHVANQYPLISLQQKFCESVELLIEISEDHSAAFLEAAKNAVKGRLTGEIVEKALGDES
jgi:uncharacterized YigZ family protein